MCPTSVEPEIRGSVVLTGEPVVLATTATVRFDEAVALPAELVAVTIARSFEPTWLEVTMKLWPVAPAMSVQTEAALQLCHW